MSKEDAPLVERAHRRPSTGLAPATSVHEALQRTQAPVVASAACVSARDLPTLYNTATMTNHVFILVGPIWAMPLCGGHARTQQLRPLQRNRGSCERCQQTIRAFGDTPIHFITRADSPAGATPAQHSGPPHSDPPRQLGAASPSTPTRSTDP